MGAASVLLFLGLGLGHTDLTSNYIPIDVSSVIAANFALEMPI
jgi:hypothetical protein